MSKSFAVLLVIVFLTASLIIAAKPVSAVTEDSWVSKAPMQEARTLLGVGVVNGKIYAIGGCTDSGFVANAYGSVVHDSTAKGVGTNEEYDPTTNRWTYKTSMPTPRLAFGVAVYKNKIYCIGGQVNGSGTGINEVYDPSTDTWETKNPMPTARRWVQANVVNGKIYLMSGYASPSNFSETLNEVYDPETDTWETKTPSPKVPITSYALVSCVFDNKIFLIGGLSNNHNLNQIYDPATDSWSFGTYPPSSVGGGAAAATTGAFALKRIYTIGKAHIFTQGAPDYSNRVYDPKTGSWMAAADLPSERFQFGIAVVNDTLHVIGGHTYDLPGYYAPVALNQQYVPLGYGMSDPSYVPPVDNTPPEIIVLPSGNQTYNESSVPFFFTVDKPFNWTGYSLDGKENITVTGNFTLTALPNGLHNLTIYANDTYGNKGASESVSFIVAVPEPFPVVPVTAIAVAAVVTAGLLIYNKKRKHYS